MKDASERGTLCLLVALLGVFVSQICFGGPPEPITSNFNILLVGQHDSSHQTALRALEVRDNIAYACHEDFFELLDVSDPAHVVSLGSCEVGGGDVALENNMAYVPKPGVGLQILDVSNPAVPALVATYPVSYPESLQSVVVKSGRAYIGDGSQGHITILDVSTPTSPIRLGRISFPPAEYPRVHLVENNLLFACGESVRIFDVSNPAQPVPAGSFFTGDTCGVAKSGDYLYVADRYRGLVVLDVSDPSAPILKGYNYDNLLKLNSPAVHAHVDGSRLYMTTDAGLCAFDISDPGKPLLTGFHFLDKSPFDSTLVGGKTYVTDLATMYILEYAEGTQSAEGEGEGEGEEIPPYSALHFGDIFAPIKEQLGNPTTLTRELLLQLTSLDASGRTVSFLEGLQFCTNLTSLNLSNNDIWFVPELAHLENLVTVNLAGNHIENIGPLVTNPGLVHGVTIDLRDNPLGTEAFQRDIPLLLQRGVQVLHDDAPVTGRASEVWNNISLLARHDAPTKAESIAVSGTRAFLMTEDDLQFLDIANPARPVKLGALPTPGIHPSSARVRIADGLAFAQVNGVLKILEVDAQPEPKVVGEFAWPGREAWSPFDFDLAGDLVYVAASDSLTILDISTIESPTVKGLYMANREVKDVIVDGNMAYVASSDQVHVLDITNPEFPVFVRRFAFRSSTISIQSLALNGHYVYAALFDNVVGGGVAVFDLNLTSQWPSLRYDTYGPAEAIVIEDGRAYLGTNSRGMVVLDIMDPAHPREVARFSDFECYSDFSYMRDTARQNGIIYAVDWDGGLLSLYETETAVSNGRTAKPLRGGWFEAGQELCWAAEIPGLTGHVTYQWMRDGLEIPDGTGSTYCFPELSESDTGWYSCRVMDEAKSVYEIGPVWIEVFPEGSLPAASVPALAALVLAFAVAARRMPRR